MEWKTKLMQNGYGRYWNKFDIGELIDSAFLLFAKEREK
jgi:hypothetical protein